MPTYDYACPDCGGFEALRSLSQRDEPCSCPDCGTASTRVFVAAPRLACLSSETRRAHETNERASHAPRSSRDGSYGRLKHPAGCGCCST
ncbi:MAG: zinc ribbon domain-containing protein, partial [Ottowia sp.]|nr:zinc ribbon domain-containing protein [Ottowia sp.]